MARVRAVPVAQPVPVVPGLDERFDVAQCPIKRDADGSPGVLLAKDKRNVVCPYAFEQLYQLRMVLKSKYDCKCRVTGSRTSEDEPLNYQSCGMVERKEIK